MADRDKPPKIPAAGALLWRPAEHGPAVLLVHRPRYDDWSFPKGKSLPGEHVLITAVREVTEETGIEINLGRRLRTVRYLSDGRPKQVDYWAARPAAQAAGGTDEPAGPAPFTPNEEVDRLAWLPLTAAGDRLSYQHDTEVLSEFASAPPATTSIILVRHASARNKKAWQKAGHPDDLTRPLTPLGQVQAKLLGQILSCFGPARVISSPAERCLATVEPYAALIGGVVEPAPALAPPPDDRDLSEAGPDEVAAAHDLVSRLVTAGEPVIISGHRENLPAMLRWICEGLGAPVPGGPPLRKGAFRALHVAGGRLISAEQHNLKS
ncbi:MAG TPA: NUDIX hydrolase [Streptosporangiaceae bacterium]|nr:NUDIX hydrolase [Streptosporangiaceae bacterium]